MKISIITVCFNSADTIEDTIRSVLGQDYKDIEYIIIDGGSTDGTLDILKKYCDQIHKYISEPDNGLYDAMNKGIKLATGDIVSFLNAGDFYAVETAILQIATSFQKNDCEVVYADLEYVAENNSGKTVRRWKSQPYRDGLFEKGWHPPHPTFFAQKSAFDKYGAFDLSYNIGADYELMLRFLKRYGITSCYIPDVLVKMRIGGKSNRNLWQIIKANIECYRAWGKNGLKVTPLIMLKKPVSKLIQYVKCD
ncbi:MAG: glycosyltransferase family 2 protein [Planctomycetota bacterium]|jgi:glycosyltransferase